MWQVSTVTPCCEWVWIKSVVIEKWRHFSLNQNAKALKAKKEEGNQAFKNNNYEAAYQLYTEALMIDPNNIKTNAKLYCNRATAGAKVKGNKSSHCQRVHFADAVAKWHITSKWHIIHNAVWLLAWNKQPCAALRLFQLFVSNKFTVINFFPLNSWRNFNKPLKTAPVQSN